MSAWDDAGVGAFEARGLGRHFTVRTRGCAGLTAAAASVMLLAGCSTGGGATAGDAAVAPGPAAPVVIVKTAPLPQRIANDAALRRDVVQTSCAAIPGGWAAKGTVENSGAKAATYKITVFFTTSKATTVDFAVARVRVGAGQTKQWTAAKEFAAQPHMLCPMPGIAKVG